MVWILAALGSIVFILIMILLVRAILMKPTAAREAKPPLENSARAIGYGDKLSKMLQQDTVSAANSEEREKFYEFHRTLEELFPNVHRVCEKVDFNGSLLFRYKGRGVKHPILFLSHQDVVEPGTGWKHAPFGGTVDATGRVWGRGAVDTKASLCCILQAMEELILEGYEPPMDVYIASSCTEEVRGDGAAQIAAYLREKGVWLDLILDEGGMILEEPIKGAKGIYAMVGVVEKGYGDVRFIAHGRGGHAGVPKKNSPWIRLSRFMLAVEKKSPFKAKLTPVVKEMFLRMAPNMPFYKKLLFANMWLFEKWITKMAVNMSAFVEAMTRTTISFTKGSGSESLNALPHRTYVTGNMRFIHHQPTEESIYIITEMARKYGLETEVLYQDNPCPMVHFSGEKFQLLEQVAAKVYPGIGVCPYVMSGGTDSSYFSRICADALRLAPIYVDRQQYESIHGVNENIFRGALPKAVDFYKEVVKMN